MEREIDKVVTPKSFIRINKKEHNIIALLELLNRNGVKVAKVISEGRTPGFIRRITGSFITADSSHLEVQLGYQETKRILESSREFRGFVDSILWEVVEY